MLQTTQVRARLLPPNTLSLTFDDGPGESDEDLAGPKSIKIAEYLHEQGIAATFFVVGKFVEKYPNVVPKIAELGHLIGNHTFSHVNFTNCDIDTAIDEIERTDQLIKNYNKNGSIFFRSPWGIWPVGFAEQINQRLDNGLNHVGPVFWDIDGSDWSYWKDGKTAVDCASNYLQAIENTGRGIVLMHDSSADNDPKGELLRKGNRTFETLQLMVPRLKELGYNFVRLDKIGHILK